MLKDAHFQTSQRITTFFQYALLIFSAPIALLTSVEIDQLLLGIVFAFIGVVGLFVMLYLSRLRVESLLYARGINRIRSILYTSGLLGRGIYEIHKGKVLLAQDKKPEYSDWQQFGFIVTVLGLFDSFYFAFGINKIISSPGIYCEWIIRHLLLITVVIGFFWLLVHFFLHNWCSEVSEYGSDYYKRIIGVDIDGVLNKHEKQFVKIFNQIYRKRKSITVSDITTLPVSESGIVNRTEEHMIFNTLEYWSDMPVNDHVFENLIEEIRNKRGYKIYIFTWRDWEICRNIKGESVTSSINKQTRKWLKDNEILYNKLLFEKGNVDRPVSLFNVKYKTRYYYSKKYKIRYFVEDTAENAIKLSHICEYVFLINHQYNGNIELPYNVVRVDGWDDILYWIKKFE